MKMDTFEQINCNWTRNRVYLTGLFKIKVIVKQYNTFCRIICKD